MEGLFLLMKLLQENKYMGKKDLKEVHFSVPVRQKLQKFIRF